MLKMLNLNRKQEVINSGNYILDITQVNPSHNMPKYVLMFQKVRTSDVPNRCKCISADI